MIKKVPTKEEIKEKYDELEAYKKAEVKLVDFRIVNEADKRYVEYYNFDKEDPNKKTRFKMETNKVYVLYCYFEDNTIYACLTPIWHIKEDYDLRNIIHDKYRDILRGKNMQYVNVEYNNAKSESDLKEAIKAFYVKDFEFRMKLFGYWVEKDNKQ